MEYRGKAIKGLEVYDGTNNDRVVARICDDCTELTNGYKLRVIHKIKEIEIKTDPI